MRIVARCLCFRGARLRAAPGAAAGCLAVVLLAVGMAGIGLPQAPAPGPPSSPRLLPAAQAALPRAREGTELVDQVGTFQVLGERVVFVAERNSQRLVALENLNLERIARTLASHPYPLQWKVSGKVTEFRGNNFILVERAIGRAATPP